MSRAKQSKKKCLVATCEKDSSALGLCYSHYRRLKLYGDPLHVQQVQFHGISVRERFFKYVKKTDGCWEWVGQKDPNGYGRMNIDGTPRLAHRLSWIFHNGDIQTGKYICHKCDNPSCTNPDHLYVGDQFDNMADMWQRGRANPGVSLGEKHGMSKLTAEKVREMRNTKGTDAEVGAIFGVSRATVHDIRIGKTWKHLQ